MPKVRFSVSEGHHIDPPRSFREGDPVGSGYNLIETDPRSGLDVTPQTADELHDLREQNHRVTYSVRLWTQPWYHYLVYRLYHFYSWHIVKAPGYYRLDNWLYERAIRRSGQDDPLGIMPWAANQDLRCYALSEKGKVQLANLEIDERLYRALSAARNNEDW